MKEQTPSRSTAGIGRKSLRRAKQPTVAFDFDLAGPLTGPLKARVEEEGWRLVCLGLTRGMLPKDPPPFGAVVKYKPSDPRIAGLIAAGCPVVRLGNFPHRDDDKIPAIVPDKAAAGRLAAEHFAEREFRHIAFIGPKPWGFTPFFFDAMRARGEELGCEMHLIQLEPSGDQGDKAAVFESHVTELSKWLQALPKPVGLVAYTTRQSTLIHHACVDAGLLMPEQVAVLADTDNQHACELLPVPLSSIVSDHEEVVRQMVRLLRCFLGGAPLPKETVFVPPKGIVTRRSTDVLAVPDPLVAKALRVIWDSFDQYITVKDVAAEVGVPRRRLERGFRRHLNRGVGEELRRKRLERCRELLRTTDLTVTDIVPQLGLRSKDYLHRFFREATGMTPRTYRLQFR